jgi:mercuric ion binding protein
MSRLNLLLLVLVSLPAFAGEPKVVQLDVSGMTCSLCPITVKKALGRVPGVLDAKADISTKSAQARYDPDKTSPAALAKTVSDAGFPAKVKE